jgi:hypothetical protein
MALPPFAITDDEELLEAVRDKTSYSDTTDEWPGSWDAQNGEVTGQAGGNIDDAKRILYMRTGSDKWYTDVAYGQALVALAAMKAKEAVENINIERYGIGDETLSFSNADPDDSQQIQSWSGEIDEALDQSDVEFDEKQDLGLKNTASYIG